MPENYGGVTRFLVVELASGEKPSPELRDCGRKLKLKIATKAHGVNAFIFYKSSLDPMTACRLYDQHLAFKRGDLDTHLDLAPSSDIPNHYIVCDEPWRVRYPGEPIPGADPTLDAPKPSSDADPTIEAPESPVEKVHPFHVIIASRVDPSDDIDPVISVNRHLAALSGQAGLRSLTLVPDTGMEWRAVIATRAPISTEEAQRLWNMHTEFIAEDGDDGLFHYTYELTPPDEIEYIGDAPATPGTELAAVPTGTRFAFVPVGDEQVTRGISALGAGFTESAEIVIVEEMNRHDDIEDDEEDDDGNIEIGLLGPKESDVIITRPGWIFTEIPINSNAANELYRMMLHHGPMSLLERIEEDGIVDHFIVHDRTWSQRVQGEKVARLAKLAENSPGRMAKTSTRVHRRGNMTIPIPMSQSIMIAASFADLCDRVKMCQAELDHQTAAVWGKLQPFETPAGDPAIETYVQFATAILQGMGVSVPYWTVNKNGDMMAVELDLAMLNSLSDDERNRVMEALQGLAPIVRADHLNINGIISMVWPATGEIEPDEEQS